MAAILELVRERGLRLVVDLREESRDDAASLEKVGAALLHLPTPDNAAIAVDHVDQGVRLAVQVMDQGGAVLVHCQHGIGRSALLALCILVDRGATPMGALELVKTTRPRISPSPSQYEGWSGWLRARGSTPPSFDAFAAVAYRHLAPA